MDEGFFVYHQGASRFARHAIDAEFIGAGPDPGETTVNFFRGVIDEIAIYDRALPESEIALHRDVGVNGP
ncbi:MAG: hypothetical protein ACKV2T_15665 [Kofleriaceae bacterium]